MIACINQATVLPADTLEFLAEARAAGFELIELDITKLEEAVQRHGLPKIREVAKSLGLQIISLNAIENYPILTRNDSTLSLSRCERIFQLSKELGCEIVVLNPNEFNAGERLVTQEAFDSFVVHAALAASRFDVKLGYEFVSYDNRLVNTLAESIQALSRWDSGVGLVLDIFHLYRTAEKIAQIPDQLMNRLWIFHVNDAPAIPVSKVKDSDRVFPGEGVVNIRQSLQELAARGFHGPVSLELFNSSYWTLPTGSVIRESWERMQGLLRRGA